MGASYSNFNIYIRSSSGAYGNNKFDVNFKKKISSICKIFIEVTYSIKYLDKKAEPYTKNILLYNDEKEKYQGEYIFGYYPSHENELVEELRVYFSILNNNVPFIISFVTKSKHTYNCLYSTLKSAGWDYGSNITRYNLGEPLTKEKLFDLYKSQSHNKKIQLKTDKTFKEVSIYKYEINSENFIFIYKPSGEKDFLGSDCLFNLDSDKPKCPESPETPKTNETINQIDQYYLDEVKNDFFDSIMVYFSCSNMALVIDFIKDCITKQYVRKDKNATYWVKQEVKYDDDTKLVEELNKMKEEAEKNIINTFILENTSPYKGVSDVKEGEQKNTYKKYTHTASSGNKPNIIFKKKPVEKIDKLETTNLKTKTLDVYFLKTKSSTDDRPFLLVFTNENGTKPPPKENKRCYHFNNTEKFEDWIELTADESPQKKDLDEKLKKKLEEIETSGSCVSELYLLKKLAYEILTKKEPAAAPPSPPAETPERPKTIPPTTVPGPGVVDILGYVAAGLVVTGIMFGVFYGIYWYNTTIKLLT